MSKRQGKRSIQVYADWEGLDGTQALGTLYSELLRGKEVFSFQYAEEWLQSEFVQQLDPDLQLYSGLHYLPDEKPNFGLFLDSSPDRWGRVLMRRREAALARKEERTVRFLHETDYLLGVFDGSRMGALRFKLDPGGNYLNDNEEMATPPWTSLRELEGISLRLEEEDAVNDPEYLQWLSLLEAPGSSLGGARPKASVLDPESRLWIAKFPSRNDNTDIGGWEIVTYELAKLAGINMAPSAARKYSNHHHTFLTMRFDRTESGKRKHFASAMTLLGYNGDQNFHDGVSYLDLVEFISTKGTNITDDLEKLWRRIVFSICVSNTDDHLRNHGFILTPIGMETLPGIRHQSRRNRTRAELEHYRKRQQPGF